MSETVDRRIAWWSAQKIAGVVDGRVHGSRSQPGIGVSTDTRTMESGTVFVALRGERFDAHTFLDEAYQKGAKGVIAEELTKSDQVRDAIDRGDLWWIEVADSERALKELGCALWREANSKGMHTVDVTGSNGKTTTKELLSRLWSAKGHCYATPGNYNNRIGVSLTLCGLPEQTDHAIIELGANAPDEIDELIRMAPGSERIITSIGPAHLDGFGSIDGVRRAKSEISHAASASETMIVPCEERDRLYLEAFPGDIVTFGPRDTEADVIYDRRPIHSDATDGQQVRIRGLGREWRVTLELPGEHNASNLAAAVATGWVRGESFGQQAADALKSIELPSGRWRRREVGGLRFVDDAYNANPASIEASLEAFLETEVNKKTGDVVLIVGDIAEMGDDADMWHRRVGERVADIIEAASVPPTAVWAVGEFRDALLAGVDDELSGEASPSLHATDEIEQVADWLVRRRPATVWMKASRAAELERVVPAVERMLADADSGAS